MFSRPRLLIAVAFLSILPGTHASSGIRGAQRATLLAQVTAGSINECSGIVLSRRNPGILWLHNDSGDSARVFAVDRQGKLLAKVSITGASANDWEDIAASGTGNTATLWIGDIGDNNRDRSNLCVYQVDEPVIDEIGSEKKQESMLARRFPFKYPDGGHDAETLMVDPRTLAVYVLTKETNGVSGLYKFPMPMTRDRKVTLERVGTITFSNPLRVRGHNIGKLATAGDISEDGNKIVVRTYAEAFIWTRTTSQTVEQAMAAKPQTISVPFIGQYEAICWDRPTGKALLTAPEGSPCPIWRITLPN